VYNFIMGSIERHQDPDGWIKASPTYKIPNTTLYDPANRMMRVITIGAGYSGVRHLSLPLTLRNPVTNPEQIMMAYKIQQQCHNVEHVIYERNPEIGGTYVLPFYIYTLSLGTIQ
jgi:hypothetical protein